MANGISMREIDKMVDIASKNGCTGCKIAGAGGGGFLMSYVPKEKQDQFRESMSAYKELYYSFDSFGSRILLNEY